MPVSTIPRQPRRAGPAAVALAGLALLTGGCAGSDSSGTGVASLATSSATATTQPSGFTGDPVKYSQCMRAHGVPKFPDPGSNGGIGIDAGALGVDPKGAVFKAAEKACDSVRPKGPPPDPKQAAEAQQHALAYSKCMRSHGIKNFPDPKFKGNSTELGLPKGLNPNTPQFRAADATCRKLVPGPDGGPGGPGPGGGTGPGGVSVGSSGGDTTRVGSNS
ncbi:MAG TPA: hypothetical protein VMU51_18715 [Mycobacteriales bacterium]|nr:hypothetical protein [Mycobacteriales bacterium]